MLFSDLAVAIRGFVGGGTWNEILAFNYDSFITFFFLYQAYTHCYLLNIKNKSIYCIHLSFLEF